MKYTHHIARSLLAIIMFAGFGINTALAQTEVVQENGKLLSINNIPIFTEQYGSQNWDIDFVRTTGLNVYGQSLIFTFDEEEDWVIVMKRVLEEINIANPTPQSASSAGSDIFYIGNEKTQENGNPIIGATGGENFAGIWDNCGPPGCVLGATLLSPSFIETYAVFREAGTGPPPEPEPEPEPEGPFLVDGSWVSSLVESQGFVFYFNDGLWLDQNYISMVVMWPGFVKWDMFWGPEDSPGSALLVPWFSTSDMKARWIQDGNEGTLVVESCTRDCPFEEGTVAPFLKWFGDGINPGGSN
jgi:hypothetical protein